MRKKVSKDYINDIENFNELPTYSKRIRYYLDENSITAKELNQKAGFSSPNVVPSLIKGERELSLDAAKKLCAIMDVSLDYLVGLTDVRTTDVEIKGMCERTGLTEAAIRALLYGNNSNMGIGKEEKFCQWLSKRALSDLIESNYNLSENSIFSHISRAYQHRGEACNILLRAAGTGALSNSFARGESNKEMQQYEMSAYFAQKSFTEWLDNFCKETNGSKKYDILWRKSVDETSNELEPLSDKERIDRTIAWLTKVRDGEVNDNGEHHETDK